MLSIGGFRCGRRRICSIRSWDTCPASPPRGSCVTFPTWASGGCTSSWLRPRTRDLVLAKNYLTGIELDDPAAVPEPPVPVLRPDPVAPARAGCGVWRPLTPGRRTATSRSRRSGWLAAYPRRPRGLRDERRPPGTRTPRMGAGCRDGTGPTGPRWWRRAYGYPYRRGGPAGRGGSPCPGRAGRGGTVPA